jgi:hypothetical protein
MKRTTLACSLLWFVAVCGAAQAYNFTFFGGRSGRPGVETGNDKDFLYSWDKGAFGGTLTWFLQRDQLTDMQCNAACFTALDALVQPELNKWTAGLDLSIAKAANANAADVLIHFNTQTTMNNFPVPGAVAFPLQTNANTLQRAEIVIDPADAKWATDGGRNSFAYTALHEWGHVLGLGDLYSIDHNGDAAGGTFEGEDFIDHGLPALDPLDTFGKGDNVMQKFGVRELDNDERAGAQWLWGALGPDSIVTGELKARAEGFNANETASHHGANTWHYRGTSSVAAPGGGTVVTIFATGATVIRDVGPGDWAGQIMDDRVIFTSQAGYAGNFEFEIDSTNPEGLINARIADNTTTDFTETPRAGFQFYPQVYGPIARPIPEPASVVLLALGSLLLTSVRGSRRRNE